MSGDKVLYVDRELTVTDQICHDLRGGRLTPPDALTGGLGALLNRVAPRFQAAGGGVLLFGPEAARALGLPLERWRKSRADQFADLGAVLGADLGRAGWATEKVSDWTTVTGQDRPRLHLGSVPALDPAECPLLADSPLDTVARFRLFHDLTGSPWHISPSTTGLDIMVSADKRRAARGKAPVCSWRLTKEPEEPPGLPEEDDYLPQYWSRKRGPKPAYLHGYDAIRMYIGAALVAEVSPWALKRTGRIAFDPRRAGWWLVRLSPWNRPEIPAPFGYLAGLAADDPRHTERWITTPTMVLLAELAAEGVYGGVEVLDSWTGPARKYPLQPYATILADAYLMSTRDRDDKRVPIRRPELVDDADVDAVRDALKLVGHRTFGALASPDSWVCRRHWWYSVMALARCNLWRKMWAVGKTTGHWPLYIDVDEVWYGSDVEDPYQAAKVLQFPNPKRRGELAGIVTDPTGLQLGKFRCKKSKRLKAA